MSESDPKISFRKAEETDRDGYWRVYIQGYPYVDKWNEASFISTWSQKGIWEQTYVGTLEESDEIVCIATVINLAESPYVMAVVVDPEYRGKGFGRQLIRYIEGDLALAGYDAVSISVMVPNYAALALYNSLGYSMRTLLVLVSGIVKIDPEHRLQLDMRPPDISDWRAVQEMHVNSPFALMRERDWDFAVQRNDGLVVEMDGNIVGYFAVDKGEHIQEIKSFYWNDGREIEVLYAVASFLGGTPLAMYVDSQHQGLLGLTTSIGLVQDPFLTEIFLEKRLHK